MIQPNRRAVLFLLLVSTYSVAPCWSADLFHLDDFQDGTTQGWAGAAAPINVPTGGPTGAGDAYLQITANGALGPGSRLATRNELSPWTGDYSGVGAQRISVDLLNPGTVPLDMRVLLVGPVVDNLRWTSTEAQVVPADGVWRTYEFFLFESELSQVLGDVSYSDLIQDVLRVAIRYDPGPPSSSGTTIAATLALDNIRLLPGGDFDADGIVSEADVNALVAAIAGGNNPGGFDLDGNAAVDRNDLNEWLRLAGNLTLGSGRDFLAGDATLDGVVDGQDFIAWNNNKFTLTPAWTAGDFDANGVVDGQDFIIWNTNKFLSSESFVGTTTSFANSFAPVPEPATAWLLAVALLLPVGKRALLKTTVLSK